MDKDEHQNQHSAYEVTGDHEPLDIPVVDKNAGDRADDGERQNVSNRHGSDLHGRSMPAESDKADYAEQGQKIAEDTHKLGQPERAERFMAQDGFQGVRRRRNCLSGGGHMVDFPPASLSQHKLIVPGADRENSLPARTVGKGLLPYQCSLFESFLDVRLVDRYCAIINVLLKAFN